MIVFPLLVVGVGLLLGVLGGGGSVLMLPLLTEHFRLDARHAAATSLALVCAAAAVGVVPHARAGRVHWRAGLAFGAAGLLGGVLGGSIGARLPEPALIAGFATLLLVTAGLMVRGPRLAAGGGATGTAAPARLPARALVAGFGVGALAAMFGAGGGFLVVPALTLFGGLAVEGAIGTSLLVVALNSAGGLVGYGASLELDVGIVGTLGALMLGGVAVGSQLTGRLPAPVLRRGFAVLLVAATALMLWNRLPAWVAVG